MKGFVEFVLGTVVLTAAYLLLTPRYLPDPIAWPEYGPLGAYEVSRLVVGVAIGSVVMMIWIAVRAFQRRRR